MFFYPFLHFRFFSEHESHSPLAHHAGRGVAVGVHMDDSQGAVTGGAGPEDRVGDQVVTTQGHRHTLVRENGPEKEKHTTILYRQ